MGKKKDKKKEKKGRKKDKAARKAQGINAIWAAITEAAWGDDAFRARLLEEPRPILEEYGLPVKEGVDYRVVADSPTLRNFVLLHPSREVAVLAVDGGDALTDENAGF